MPPSASFSRDSLKDGDRCKVIAGTHKGKAGLVKDINKTASGTVTITVVQDNGERFKTLMKNVEAVPSGKSAR
jgi:ribosomal protein S4E